MNADEVTQTRARLRERLAELPQCCNEVKPKQGTVSNILASVFLFLVTAAMVIVFKGW